MKTFTPIVLGASVLLNATLFALLLAGMAAEREAPRPILPAARPTTPAPPPAYDAATWERLRTDDLPALVTRLREAGFPPLMVRALVQAQLEEELAARRKALIPDADSAPYWRNAVTDANAELALRQLSRENFKRMRELLGADADHFNPLNLARQNRQLAHLPAEKAEQVRQVMREFNDLRMDQYTSAIGFALVDREKIAALEKRQNQEIARLLSAAEFEEFELRSSYSANSLRSRLHAFDATEDEFRMMFRIMRPFEDQYAPMYAPSPPEVSRRRAENQRQVNEQIKAALGPVRGAEFERASNFEYGRTSQLVARLQLPPETTGRLWEVQQEFQKRAQGIQAERELAVEQRNQQLAALTSEAAAKLKPLLGGDRGFEAYRQNTYWLNNLVPRPALTPRR